MSGIKRKALSIEDKLKILKTFDENSFIKNQKQIAEELNIPASTLRTILKNRKELEELAVQGGTKRKKIKTSKFEELEKVLLQWFQQARSLHLPVNGVILTEKAKEVAKELKIDDFSGSSGWLDRFKSRHGIIYRQICGEAESVHEEDAEMWKQTVLPELLKGFSPNDVFNADEFGLFFKLMPDKSLVYKDDKCHGGKRSKERISILACANADGTEKIKLLVVGKAKSPRCFKNVRSLPGEYVAQRRAWMTGEQFVLWVKQMDAKFRKKNRKILLLIDNCPSHPKNIQGLSNIKIVFLPPNGTSKLQPMDQGIIKVMKQHYRKRLVLRYLDAMEKAEPSPSINLLEAINYITAAWESVRPDVIKNCFAKAGIKWSDQEIMPEPEIEKEEEAVFENYPEYVTVDDDIATTEVRSLQEIVVDITGTRCNADESDGDDDDDEDRNIPAPPTAAAALTALYDVRRYVSNVPGISNEAITKISELETLILNSSFKKVKQNKIENYFLMRE